jgi:putative Holliday junction resolvase
MAFDYGLRRIGVAVGNGTVGTSQPLTVLSAKDGVPDWNRLGALVQEWEPELLLVGDPLNMDGSVSELALRARRFGRRLHGRLQLPVELVDERLSSVEARQQRREAGDRGGPVDSYAAELILRTWLAER